MHSPINRCDFCALCGLIFNKFLGGGGFVAVGEGLKPLETCTTIVINKTTNSKPIPPRISAKIHRVIFLLQL